MGYLSLRPQATFAALGLALLVPFVAPGCGGPSGSDLLSESGGPSSGGNEQTTAQGGTSTVAGSGGSASAGGSVADPTGGTASGGVSGNGGTAAAGSGGSGGSTGAASGAGGASGGLESGGAGGQPSEDCGNGLIDSDEECDDGETEGGDGCSSTCQSSCEDYDDDAVEGPNGHCYLHADVALTWALAVENCSDLEGHLVTITSSDENSFVESLLGDGGGWIGGSDGRDRGNSECGEYSWVTEEDWYDDAWANNQPNCHDHPCSEPGPGNAWDSCYEHCAFQNSGSATWNDLDCAFELDSVCEWDPAGT